MSNLKVGKEGLLLAAKNNTFNDLSIIYESEERNIATFQVIYPNSLLRIIIVHGPQEGSPMDLKLVYLNNIKAEIERSIEIGAKLLITGDFNAKLEASQQLIGNGKLLHDLVQSYNLKVLNFDGKTNGKWTRIQLKNKVEIKSVLDYIIADTTLHELFTGANIDECKLYTPYRIKKQSDKINIVHSDHCSISSSFYIKKGRKVVRKPVEKKVVWKLTPEGLDKFERITKDKLEIGKISDIAKPYEVWLSKVYNIMYKCFKRVTVKERTYNNKMHSKVSQIRKILSDVAKKGRIQRCIVHEYSVRLIEKDYERKCRISAEKLKETMRTITVNGKFSTKEFWKVRKKFSAKHSLQPEVIKTQNGITTRDPEVIKDEVAKEFKHRLRNREPHPGWEEYVSTTNKVVQELVNLKSDTGPPFSMDELCEAIKHTKEGTAPGNDYISSTLMKRAGTGVLSVLLEIFNLVKDSLKIPERWNEVLITMIYKNKGSHLELNNHRGIFLTLAVTKLFEKILQNRMQPSLDKISLSQAGSRKGRSVSDNLFLVREAINHAKYLNKQLVVTTYDFQQAFDSMWLEESILSLRRLGVDDYILRLVYTLNKTASVQVKTPYGLTKPFVVYDIGKQGGVLGPILCSASTAEYNNGNNKGVSVGTTLISSLEFVDDMMDLSSSINDAIDAHEQAILFSAKKKWSYSTEKCGTMIVNKPKVENESEDTILLKINGEVVRVLDVTKYLGDLFNVFGNNADLIKDRVQRGTRAVVSIDAFMRDNCFGQHTVSTYITLYYAVFLASVLFNSEAWSCITDRDLCHLEKLQISFLKKILGIKKCASNSFTFLELGVLPIKHELHIRQICFFYHLLTLDDHDPAKTLLRNLQALPAYSNWWSNVKDLMEHYTISHSESNILAMSKATFKKHVRKAVTKFSFESLVNECKSQSKTKNLEYSEFKISKYLLATPPPASKYISQARSKTINIKYHLKYNYNDTNCRWCGIGEETLDHVVNCDVSNSQPILNPQETVNNNSSDIPDLVVIATRIKNFLERVE